MYLLYSTISVFYALNNDPEGEEEALAKMSQIEAPTQLIWGKHDQVKTFFHLVSVFFGIVLCDTKFCWLKPWT